MKLEQRFASQDPKGPIHRCRMALVTALSSQYSFSRWSFFVSVFGYMFLQPTVFLESVLGSKVCFQESRYSLCAGKHLYRVYTIATLWWRTRKNSQNISGSLETDSGTKNRLRPKPNLDVPLQATNNTEGTYTSETFGFWACRRKPLCFRCLFCYVCIGAPMVIGQFGCCVSPSSKRMIWSRLQQPWKRQAKHEWRHVVGTANARTKIFRASLPAPMKQDLVGGTWSARLKLFVCQPFVALGT